MVISRHYLTCGDVRVHYRLCGAGPPLLMLHQSPRSSSEYAAIMPIWGQHFTCIAPDIPGFGHSDPLGDPLPLDKPELEDFADAIVAFCDAAGLPPLPAYGFHSGGIMLVTAMKRDPARFTALAIGGYAVWDDADRTKIGDVYVPPNPPRPYGEHLLWLWNRVLEQSWYFPWYEPADETRLPGAHDDVARVDSIIQDLLNSGDHYAAGYAAVLRGKRDLPPPDAVTSPVRITAYTGDPLKDHLARLGDLPTNWDAFAVDTPADHHAASLEFLLQHRDGAAQGKLPHQDADAGFLSVTTAEYQGLIHWRGPPGSRVLRIHAPAASAELIDDDAAICIDMPGHGDSDRWPGDAPLHWSAWQAVIDAVAGHFSVAVVHYDLVPVGDPDRLYPDLSPDRFGHYLTKAWAIVRAEAIYAPWYAACKDTAIPIDARLLSLDYLAKAHRARLRGNAARAFHIASRERTD